MKLFHQAILFIGFLFVSCNQVGNKANSISETNSSIKIDDTVQIINLVKQVYKWQWSDSSKNDQVPLKDDKDSIYVGIDLGKHKIRLNELRNTNFFSDEFINNYDKIVRTIDRKLKSKEYEWAVGDLQPFGNDTNPWCNCQDYPDDNSWWDKIKFKFINLDSNNATLNWTWAKPEWSKDFTYTIKVVKTNGTWKIAYLQGFDFDKYIH